MPKSKNLNKLILFNIVYLSNFSLFWILLVLCLISQPAIEITIYFIEKTNMINYSLLMILIPLILSFVFILFQITVLFQDSKINSIEYKLICSKYSKLKITFSRIISVFIILLIITLVQDIFLFFFIIVKMLKFGLALFIANTFINSFVYLLILGILTLITSKLKKVSFIIVSTVIGIFTLGISLFSRLLVFGNKYKFDYNNDNYSNYKYARLVDGNKNNILIGYQKSQEENKSSEQAINEINNINMINNFIPSEWLMSFYSSLFLDMKFDLNFNNSFYNLLSIKVINSSESFKASDYLNYYSIRANDLNFSNLSNEEYSKIIFKNIDEIINKYNFLNNSILVDFIYGNITKYQIWNDIVYNVINDWEIIMDFLRDITGINTKYNQLFYAIKYKNLILDKIPNLFIDLENEYNQNISKLIKYIFMSDATRINLFDNDNLYDIGVLWTNQTLDYFYPNIDVVVNNEKPSEEDVDFVKNKLIKFTLDNNNQVSLSYLNSNLIYSITNNELEKFNNSFPDITDYESWSNYIDSIQTYSDLDKVLFDLLNVFNDIYQYKLTNNTINVSNSSLILTPFYSENNLAPKIIIFSYVLLFGLLTMLVFKTNKFSSKRRQK